MPGLCDHCLPPSVDAAHPGSHISIGHTICYLIEQQLFPSAP
jgi:hypothetical protein